MLKKVKELSGKELDYAVGKARGWINYPEDSIEHGDTWHCDPEKAPFGRCIKLSNYTPSSDWGQAGALIEEFGITLYAPRHLIKNVDEPFGAQIYIANHPDIVRGKDPLEAVCRCFVISKGIYEIDIF